MNDKQSATEYVRTLDDAVAAGALAVFAEKAAEMAEYLGDYDTEATLNVVRKRYEEAFRTFEILLPEAPTDGEARIDG